MFLLYTIITFFSLSICFLTHIFLILILFIFCFAFYLFRVSKGIAE